MRVGLVIYNTLQTQSGGYLYDRKLVECLRAAGDEVEIFSLPWRAYPARLAQTFFARFARRLVDAKVDILLQDELNHPSLFWLNRRLRRVVRYPMITIVHHLRSSEQHAGIWMPLYRQVERAYLQSVDGAVFNSHTTRRAVESLLGRPLAGVVATPAGDRFGIRLEAEEIQARLGPPAPVRLLFVGNIIPRKGLETLLRALARVASSDWQLRIAGRMDADRVHAEAMRRLAVNLRLAERVIFLGGVGDAELERELRQAHLLVIPSQYEGFGIAYLEGMGFGLPAVGTNAGGASEIIQPGVSGLLITPEDVSELARGLERLLTDRAELLRMSLAARRRFDDFPGWDAGMNSLRSALLAMRAKSPDQAR